jgi:AraC family transcriptional regulator
VGETLHDFVKRVRLERALYLMSHRDRPALTDVALACDLAPAPIFRAAFVNTSAHPRARDVEQLRDTRRDQLWSSLPGGHRVARQPERSNPDAFTVRLRDLPARRVAYLRVFRPYEGDHVSKAAARLLAWAKERGLAGGQWLGYQWEDPEIVQLELCRYDVGVEVPETASIGGDVTEIRFSPMKVAEVEIAGPIELEIRALRWLYTSWLPQSGFVPDHQPGFEAWVGEPFAHGVTHFEVRLQLAVVAATRP